MKKNKKIKLLSIVIISLSLLLIIFLSLKNIVENLNIGENYTTKMIEGKAQYYLSQNNDSEDMCNYLSDIEYIKEQSSVEWGSITLDSNLETQYNHGLITLIINGKKTYFLKGISAHANSTVVYDISKYDYDYFTSYVGIDESRGNNSNGVKFYIYTSMDGENWELRTDKNPEVLKGTDNASFIKINIKDAKYLKLECNKNGNNTADHAVYADAKLYKEGYQDKTSQKVEFIKTIEEYDNILKDKTLEQQIKDNELILLQRTFVDAVGYDLLQAIVNQKEQYKEAVQWLMSDVENLRLYVLGGEPDGGSYYNSIKELARLYSAYKNDFNDETLTNNKWYPDLTKGDVYKKMAISLSLTHATKVGYWAQIDHPSNRSDSLTRYQIYKDLYDEGKFIVSKNADGTPKQDHTPWFEALQVEEMRYVMNNITDDEELKWLNAYTQKRIDEHPNEEEKYLQPHTYIAYVWPNFENPIFHDVNKKEYWDKVFEGIFSVYNVTYSTENDHVYKAWMSMRNEYGTGAVCGGISKLGAHIRAAHGTPASVVGQPGHAAIIYYRKNEDGKGYWTLDNDVSGWAQSGKSEKLGTRMPLGWGSDSYVNGYAATYIMLSQEALNDNENYEKSEKIIMTAKLYEGDLKKQEQIYREALEVQKINIDAWWGLINVYNADSSKTDEDYYELAEQLGDALMPFPLPMKNLLDQIQSKIVSTEYIFKFTILETQLLNEGKTYEATDRVLQPSITRTVANYLLGQIDTTLANFSFDGEDAGKIVLSDRFDNTGIRWDYILNGKSTNADDWTEVNFSADEEHKLPLTQEQINNITAENDIYVHIVGTDYEDVNIYKIDITEQENPEVYANDLENRIVGVSLNTEWRYNENEEWTSYNIASPDLTGDKSVQIRQPASNTMLASEPVTYEFTEDNQETTRKYVPVSHLSIEKVSTEEPGHNGAASNAIDGNYNTRYHSNWSGKDTERYMIIKVDNPIYLSAVEFVPAGGGNGKIVDGTIYGSMDGENWEELAKQEGLTYEGDFNSPEFGKNPNNIKKFEIEDSKEVQYIKIVADKTNGNWFTARMFNIFQDLSKNPHITAGIAFSPSTSTNENVEARLINPSVEIEITNNDGKDTYEFKDNGTFTFEFTDKATHTKKGKVEARVDWIDREAPTATIKYSTEVQTFDEVVAELIPSEDVTVTNIDNFELDEENDKKIYTYTFKRNGEFKFEFQDAAGNTGEAIAKVNWIKSTEGHLDSNDSIIPENPGETEDPGTDPSTPENPGEIEDPGTDPNEGELEKVESDEYVIENGYISKIMPKTTLDEFKQNIKANQELMVIDKNGNIVEEDAKLATGMTVKVGSILQYNIVVTGDTDGNGEANFQDILQINKHRLKKEKLEGASLIAGDVNRDGIADFKDILQINKYRLLKIMSF